MFEIDRPSRNIAQGRDLKHNNGREATLLKTSPQRLSKTTSSSKDPQHPRRQMLPSMTPLTRRLTRGLRLQRGSPPGQERLLGGEIHCLPEEISKLQRSGEPGFGPLCWTVLWITRIGGSMEWDGLGRCLGKYFLFIFSYLPFKGSFNPS